MYGKIKTIYLEKIGYGQFAGYIASVENGEMQQGGQLGLGDSAPQKVTSPQKVMISSLDITTDPNARAVAIYAGHNSSYMVSQNGTIWAWGSGEEFMEGTGYGSTPVRLQLLKHAVEVDGRYVLKSGATVWLLPKDGSSPDITKDKSLINPIERIIDIAAHDNASNGHILAVDVKGDLWSAGSNDYGQLGRDTSDQNSGGAVGGGVSGSQSLVPVVQGNGGKQLGNVVNITAGDKFSAAVVKTTQTKQDVDGLGTPVMVKDYDHYDLYTWGRNDSGQTGLGVGAAIVSWPTLASTVNSIDPTERDQDTLLLSGGDNHLITARRDGSMWTAGNNRYGQLGNISTIDSNILVLVGQQNVTVAPTHLTVKVGQTLNLTTLPLNVNMSSGVNLLLLSVSGSSGWTPSATTDFFTLGQNANAEWLLTGVKAGKAMMTITVAEPRLR